jgi:hypothetical protein
MQLENDRVDMELLIENLQADIWLEAGKFEDDGLFG